MPESTIAPKGLPTRLRHADDRRFPASRPATRPSSARSAPRRQGGDRHRLHQGQRRGRTDPRPGQVLARTDLRPGGGLEVEDHRRRRLLRRRDRSLRRHQRDPAAGRGQPRDLPADRHLPLADVLPDPARRGDLRRAALALARLRPDRARRHRQRPVELDHVGARPRARGPTTPCCSSPATARSCTAHDDKHEAMRTALASAGPAIFASAADRDRRPALPDARQGQRHRRPRARSPRWASPAPRSRC